MTSKPRGSPIVKTVFQPRRRKLPVVTPSSPSDWSTIGQHTTTDKSSVAVMSQDWSEEEDDTDGYDHEEEYDEESPPEQLREAVLHAPLHLPQALQGVAGDHHHQPVRSPAVESLGDLLGIKTRKYKLLPSSEDSSSSSSEELAMLLPSKTNNVMTSTMVAGNKEKKQKMCLEDLSVIKPRESMDPRQSLQPYKKKADPCTEIGGAHRKTENEESRYFKPLSSTPASGGRNQIPLIKSGGSFDLSSIHSSEAGGSMLVPRVEREIITEERVEDTESEDENWYSKLTDKDPEIQEHTLKTASPSLHSQSPHTIMIPESDSEAVPEPDHPDTSPKLCQYPPPPHKGGVSLTITDYQTLSKGTFLNDAIIDFYLLYLFRERLADKMKEKIFLFSSYFFKKLSTEPEVGSMMAIMESESKLSLAQRRHRRVHTWTKTVTLAHQQMVIFPICKSSHWFLVTAVMARDKIFLVVMDSLGGDNVEAVNMIKEYLFIEIGVLNLEAVRKMEVVYPSLPQQENFTDCGLYLLHYVEKIVESPQDFCCLKNPEMSNWFPKSEVTCKRSSLAKLIRRIAEDQALPAQAPVFPNLVTVEEEVMKEEFDTSEDNSVGYNLPLSIQAELSNLSPPSHRSRSRLSSSDTSGEIFSSVVHRTQVTMVVPCPPVSRGMVDMVGVARKRFRLATRQTEPAMTIFSPEEYYRGKQSSERKFDELLQGEVGKEEGVFSQ